MPVWAPAYPCCSGSSHSPRSITQAVQSAADDQTHPTAGPACSVEQPQLGPADPMVKRRRVGRRGPARRRRPPVSQRELDKRWLKSFYDSWGSPTPPPGRDVLKYAVRRNESRAKSQQRQERKEQTAASFRSAKAKRTRRLSGRVRGDGQAAITVKAYRRPAAKVPERTRGAEGHARRGAPSTLTRETAQQILELRAQGLTVSEIGKSTGNPASTISYWFRSGRATARAAAKS